MEVRAHRTTGGVPLRLSHPEHELIPAVTPLRPAAKLSLYTTTMADSDSSSPPLAKYLASTGAVFAHALAGSALTYA